MVPLSHPKRIQPRSKGALIVELSGGFANQLFQWAVGTLLAAEYDRTLIIDGRIVTRPNARGEQLRQFGLPIDRLVLPSAAEQRFWRLSHQFLPRVPLGAIKRIAGFLYRLDGANLVRNLGAARSALLKKKPVRMRGLFQECDYLYKNRDSIKKLLPTSHDRTRSGTESAPYAAMHIRRGDYVSVPKYAQRFGVCSETYYEQASSLLDTTLPVVLVSDDLDWSLDFRNRINEGSREIQVARGSDHFDDFRTLVLSDQLVLSNSTFSWWAAFLSDADKIICPDPWFNDSTYDQGLARTDWIKIARD